MMGTPTEASKSPFVRIAIPKAWCVAALLGAGLLASTESRAQAVCGTSQSQVNHDHDLPRDCATGLCIERVCVDTLFRRATVCGHGFQGTPAVNVGGDRAPVLSTALPSPAGACGSFDEALVIGLDDADEGQQKLAVSNGTRRSEPFFIRVGELAGPQGPIGPAGPVGPKGDTGATGAPGAKGDPGARGDPGATGAPGARGDTGAVGATGEKGDVGAAGPRGDTGATGAMGMR